MSFELDALWQERHDDEHKIRRDDHRSPYQRDELVFCTRLPSVDCRQKLKSMETAWKTFTAPA